MSLNITRVQNASKPIDEIVWLRASADLNLKGYALVDKTFDSEENVSNEFRHVFFFENKKVKAGDVIAVVTGKGKNGEFLSSGGYMIHHIYWQSETCVWNDKGGDRIWLINYTVEDDERVPAV